MAEIQLVAEPGRAEGSRASRRLRHAGRIPAVVYGHGIDPISVSVDARELRAALNGEAGTRALLQLQIGSEHHLAVARQLQRHPVRHTVTHIDFQVVSRDEVIGAEVPITLVGDAVAVHRGDGTVAQDLMALAVKARPADLPPHIEVDVSGLEIGSTIRVGDLNLPDGVETDVDPDQAIVVGQPPRVVIPEEAEAAGAEEGAAEPAAEEAEAAGGEGAGES
ncbi:MAG TPA: 50S ribosomal protein L25 [Acidimicrobiales bacterium]|nr:50S ribosomal protein L25 [Acidimicrobiales bacterium]